MRAAILNIGAREAPGGTEITLAAQGQEARMWMRRLRGYLDRTNDAELRIAGAVIR